MFPKISDLINYLIGTRINMPVQSYGFMMAVAFLFGGWILYLELKRLEKAGLIHAIPKKSLKGAPGEILVHPYQLAGNIGLIAGVAGIAGAKIFDTLEHLPEFINDPFGTIFSFSGLSFYGGLIVAAFAVIWYAEKNKIRFPFIMDATAPALILAYAIGRIGCQLAGDGCWGIPNMLTKPSWLTFLPGWMWAFQFPHNVINEGVPLPGCTGDHCFILMYPVFPTSFYETILGLIIFGILWLLRKHLPVPGYLFSIYLILNGAERFLIEQIRVNPLYQFFNLKLTQAEIIAILLIVLGFTGFWFYKWVHKRILGTKIYTASNPEIKSGS
ncbi:MAG: prolipoprotein diacylglyceryl transferase [Bacteroidetes bacterium]|nr:prolipoprotein diacylglyceryl transferase [Bacteroidota bacterium]